jgi:cytochrome c-type biogenesis protein CcmE
MKRTHLKVLAGGIILATAATLLGVAGLKEGWVYFLHVDQYIVSESHQNQRVRLTGIVGAEDLVVSNAGLIANFYLTGETASLRVEYTGVIPDMFRPGHEVIVEGRRNEQGVFIADTLLTKCGSRYESDEPQQPANHPPMSALSSETPR